MAEHSCTSTLIPVLKKLESTDFTKMMGSGINITLTDLEDVSLMSTFTINAEDMEEIKPAIIQSLRSALALRKNARKVEIGDIEKALGH